jgi:type VI secretion system protein ImpE
MERARDLFRQGRLAEAIDALAGHLRDRPSDSSARIFLFELLCFSGDLGRAQKHLEMLPSDPLGPFAARFKAILEAERTLQDFYKSSDSVAEAPVRAIVNGKEFQSVSDAFPEIGGWLDLIVDGAFRRLPIRLLRSLRSEAPAKLRDLYWMPARVELSVAIPPFSSPDILIPVLYPGSAEHDDDGVRLGRLTDWAKDEEGHSFFWGARVLKADEEEIPLVDIRELIVLAD